MGRFAILSIMLASGCGTSTTPQLQEGRKETPQDKHASLETKKGHEYKGWIEFAPTDAGFQVRIPKEPIVKTGSSASSNLNTASILRKTADDLGFICQWEIRDQTGRKEAEVIYLKGQQFGMLIATKGQLIEEKEIALDHVQGREWIIAIGENKQFPATAETLRCRSYVVSKRMISLQVIGKNADAVRSTDAVTFLESLKISK